MLKIIDLTKVYPTGAKALTGVSFDVDLPQVVAIIRPSGAGKSTLIRCINRLIDPTSGQVMLDGTNLVTLSRSDLRKARRHRHPSVFLNQSIPVAGSCLDPSVGLWGRHYQRVCLGCGAQANQLKAASHCKIVSLQKPDELG
jgi:ABC-type glutathione transport system ATPase component